MYKSYRTHGIIKSKIESFVSRFSMFMIPWVVIVIYLPRQPVWEWHTNKFVSYQPLIWVWFNFFVFAFGTWDKNILCPICNLTEVNIYHVPCFRRTSSRSSSWWWTSPTFWTDLRSSAVPEEEEASVFTIYQFTIYLFTIYQQFTIYHLPVYHLAV